MNDVCVNNMIIISYVYIIKRYEEADLGLV